MGTLSPCPWDLPLSGQQDEWWDRRDCPTLSAIEPALGSHPCVALSSAQAFSFYLQLASFHGKGASSLWPAAPVAPRHTTYRFSASRSALPDNDSGGRVSVFTIPKTDSMDQKSVV